MWRGGVIYGIRKTVLRGWVMDIYFFNFFYGCRILDIARNYHPIFLSISSTIELLVQFKDSSRGESLRIEREKS